MYVQQRLSFYYSLPLMVKLLKGQKYKTHSAVDRSKTWRGLLGITTSSLKRQACERAPYYICDYTESYFG